MPGPVFSNEAFCTRLVPAGVGVGDGVADGGAGVGVAPCHEERYIGEATAFANAAFAAGVESIGQLAGATQSGFPS
jgi:hypothetical protein